MRTKLVLRSQQYFLRFPTENKKVADEAQEAMSYYEKPKILFPKRKVSRNHHSTAQAAQRMRIRGLRLPTMESSCTSACNYLLMHGL